MAMLQTLACRLNRMREEFRLDRKGWTICFCVLIITIIRSGITYSFGIFVVELEKLYKRPMAEQNWIGTLSFTVSLSCAPVSVALIRALKHNGYRLGGLIGSVIISVSCLGSSFITSLEWLFLTHSLLYGIGSSLIYMASSLVIGEYFDKDHRYHVLATSILLCGYPIGSLLFNPINSSIVTHFGWRVAFRVSSVLTAVFGFVCCWQFTVPEAVKRQRFENEEGDDEQCETSDDGAPRQPSESRRFPGQEIKRLLKENTKCCNLRDMVEKPEIPLWYAGNMLSYLGFYMPFLNLPFYMELKKIHSDRSASALSLLSLSECITYMLASFFGDYFKGRLALANVIASTALGFICLMWPVTDVNYSVIILSAITMGGFLGVSIVYTYAASGEVTGLPIDQAWSFTNLWSGMGILMGPFFSGFIYDFRKSYDDVFYVVGALYLVDAVIFAAILYLVRRRDALVKASKLDYSEIMGPTTNTIKISTKSTSKSSIADIAEGNVGYGISQQDMTQNGSVYPVSQQQDFANFGSSGANYQQGYGTVADHSGQDYTRGADYYGGSSQQGYN